MTKQGEVTDFEVGKKRGPFSFVRDVAIVLVLAVVFAYLLNTFLVRSFYIPSSSMEDTLQVNDRIMVSKLEPAIFPVKRGDIVVFKDPGGWLTGGGYAPPSNPIQHVLQAIGLAPDTSNQYVVKRVIGVGGDRVKCCNSAGQMTVNGVALHETYVKLPPQANGRVSAIDFDVTVPKDSLWVMGDNRYQSKDSRYNQDQPGHGFVPVSDVVGRAFVLTWPVQRFRLILRPDDVFGQVPDAEQEKSSQAKAAALQAGSK